LLLRACQRIGELSRNPTPCVALDHQVRPRGVAAGRALAESHQKSGRRDLVSWSAFAIEPCRNGCQLFVRRGRHEYLNGAARGGWCGPDEIGRRAVVVRVVAPSLTIVVEPRECRLEAAMHVAAVHVGKVARLDAGYQHSVVETWECRP
jgi:hypothetical protein